MKVMIACGGTGGHLFPGLAVAEALRLRQHQVRLLVSEKTVDQTALAALTNSADNRIEVEAVPAVPYEGPRRLVRFGARLLGATRKCAERCDEFGPDVVLGMGGFTSAPAIFGARWARKRKTATLVHESNAVPGKANRWAGKFVDHVAVGLADCARFFGGRPVTVTGTPIRSALQGGKVADARARFGLRPDRLTVLVAGGSQGARAINEAMACALPWLKGEEERVQFVHLTGAVDAFSLRESYEKNGFDGKVMAFCNQMELAYSAADLVVARSGASTLTEIAGFGLPSILIPYPLATGNHQWHNARIFENAGAARLLDQAQLASAHAERGERLAGLITEMLNNETERARMAKAAKSLAVDDAAERLVALLEQYGQ